MLSLKALELSMQGELISNCLHISTLPEHNAVGHGGHGPLGGRLDREVGFLIQ